jgi:hypothetical protein
VVIIGGDVYKYSGSAVCKKIVKEFNSTISTSPQEDEREFKEDIARVDEEDLFLKSDEEDLSGRQQLLEGPQVSDLVPSISQSWLRSGH